ncbi:MAG: Hg(II)-responsive transcriptional regulator [Gammaproteobacteria bacterium]
MKETGLTIGKLAQQAGVNVETIRYYQRVGLIQEPIKPLEGYRRYLPETVNRVCFIKRAKGLGFTLKEIADLLTLEDGHCQEVRELAEHKHRLITQRMDDLRAMQSALAKLIKQCKRNKDERAVCAIIDTLTRSKID